MEPRTDNEAGYIENKRGEFGDSVLLILSSAFEDSSITKKITWTSCDVVPDLSSNQTKLDSRIFFLLSHIDKFFIENGCTGKAVIYSVDSDIMVLALHHFQYFSNIDLMWFETGHQDLEKSTSTHRFVPIHDICSSLDPALPKYYLLYMRLLVVILHQLCIIRGKNLWWS